MNRSMHLGLRAGERLYVNGAVLRVDRKVSIELLNDVSFLLEAHVMQPEETTTPLRQLYFAIQLMLIDKPNSENAGRIVEGLLASLNRTLDNEDIIAGLGTVETQIGNDRLFDALKTIRAMFPVEERVLAGERSFPRAETHAAAPTAAA
ncbi:flagellar biosynthesis repressor FlbT [Flaviflagellibacter deserti]|uniref:Flagellar biosynthesis repressor FlbT n=1 Tax=Flaviflagellibacter deserti TaxID=2267266 RepID=A0ABV9Z6F2_9HYPH